jgi:membrane-bound lytic murein transglycosylase A
VLLWVDDPVELFFLQVQGSGRVQLPDGSMVRRLRRPERPPLQSIGRCWPTGRAEASSRRRCRASRPGRAPTRALEELLNANPSYVFFREAPAGKGTATGRSGALGVPLTAGRSIAVDPRHVPLGAPVFLATSSPRSTNAAAAPDAGAGHRRRDQAAWCAPTSSGASAPRPARRPGG